MLLLRIGQGLLLKGPTRIFLIFETMGMGAFKNVLLSLLVAWAIFSCHSPSNTRPIHNNATPSKYKHLLSQYQQISFDTMKVFSVSDPDSVGYMFRGKRLARKDIMVLPNEILQSNYGYEKVYACYTFKTDGPTVGLITRVPDEYNSNAVKLFILDTVKDTIMDVVELASAWGDAGDFSYKNALLVSNKGPAKLFIAYTEGHDSDEQNDSSVYRKTNFYQLSLKNGSFDTVARNTEGLIALFNNMKN